MTTAFPRIARALLPGPWRRIARAAIDQREVEQARERADRFSAWLEQAHPRDYARLHRADLPERLRRTVLSRLAEDPRWKACWPSERAPPVVEADVAWFTYAAHPDVLKQCIALKRSMPGIRTAIVSEIDGHTEHLLGKHFDEHVVFGEMDPPRLLAYLRNARVGVAILRYRNVAVGTLARLLREEPLVYSPPGYYLSSRSDDYLADRGLTFVEAFEADRFLLENADGLVHFLSDAAFDWFRANGVRLPARRGTVYVGCMDELEPSAARPKLSDFDGGWHIVHATGAGPVGTDPRKGGETFLPIGKCRTVVEQGIHLHVFITYLDRSHPGYGPFLRLAEESPYFHLEDPVPFDVLLETMTAYDFAWKHWDARPVAVWPSHAEHITPNFMHYVQSGLPLLMSPNAPPMEARLARELGLAVFVGEDELPRLKAVLDAHRADLPALRQRVERAKRTALSYDTKTLHGIIEPLLPQPVRR